MPGWGSSQPRRPLWADKPYGLYPCRAALVGVEPASHVDRHSATQSTNSNHSSHSVHDWMRWARPAEGASQGEKKAVYAAMAAAW